MAKLSWMLVQAKESKLLKFPIWEAKNFSLLILELRCIGGARLLGEASWPFFYLPPGIATRHYFN